MNYLERKDGGVRPASARTFGLVIRRRLDLELIAMLLNNSSEYQVPVAATTLEGFLSRQPSTCVDVLLIDTSFSGMDLVDFGRKAISQSRTRNILFLDHKYNLLNVEVAEAVPAAYCSRDVGTSKLLGLIDALLELGDAKPSLANGLIENRKNLRIDSEHFVSLTPRQIQVLTLLAEGKTAPECAQILGLSTSTVENHRAGLMHRLKLRKNVELVRWAIRKGIIDP